MRTVATGATSPPRAPPAHEERGEPSPAGLGAPPPLGREPHAGHALLGGSLAGALGRVGTNNLSQMAANLQSGTPKLDLSGRTARSLLLGSSVQTGIVYGLQRAVGPSAEAALGAKGRAGVDVLAGIAGGLAMHPGCVRFFLQDELAAEVGASRFPAFRGMYVLLQRDPMILGRGVLPRCTVGALEWGIFSRSQAALQARLPQEKKGLADPLAALGAIVATTPIYQMYVHQIKTGAGHSDTFRTLFGSAAKQSSLSVTALFIGIAVLEKVLVDRTKVTIEAGFTRVEEGQSSSADSR